MRILVIRPLSVSILARAIRAAVIILIIKIIIVQKCHLPSNAFHCTIYVNSFL